MVIITYDGNTIATLEGGKTAVVKCAGKKMKTDLTVVAPEDSGGGTVSVTGVRTLNDTLINDRLDTLGVQTIDEAKEYAKNHPSPIIYEHKFSDHETGDVNIIPLSISINGGTALVVFMGWADVFENCYIGAGSEVAYDTISGDELNIKDSGAFGEWLLVNSKPVTV